MKCQFPSDKATYGYIRQKDLLTILPFSPATLWRKVKAGTFVQPVKLSARITAWSKAEVRAGPGNSDRLISDSLAQPTAA